MNGNYYQNPTFPSNASPINMDVPSSNMPQPIIPTMNSMPMEQSFLENILKLNKGKRINAYISFQNNSDWQSKTISGIIEEIGSDYIIISDPSNNNWYLIKLDNLDYIEFMERINSN